MQLFRDSDGASSPSDNSQTESRPKRWDGKDEALDNWIETAKKANPDKKIEVNNFKICPHCNQKSLQIDGGCLNCINPECGYSKCS